MRHARASSCPRTAHACNNIPIVQMHSTLSPTMASAWHTAAERVMHYEFKVHARCGWVVAAGVCVCVVCVTVQALRVGLLPYRHACRPGVVLSYATSALCAMLTALCYAEFASDLPVAGGAFNYVSMTFGEFAAW